jgi:hypothetical protein
MERAVARQSVLKSVPVTGLCAHTPQRGLMGLGDEEEASGANSEGC